MLKRLDFRDLWKRKKEIIEGFYNRYLNISKRIQISNISTKRLLICRSNLCGYYDPYGTSEMAYIYGAETCGGCGCGLEEKTSCLSCSCFLAEIGKNPMWTSEELKPKK